MLGKQIVSERTVILWLVSTVAATVLLMGLAAPLIYLVYGCWPFGATETTGGCLAHIQPGFLKFLPPLAGIVAGSAWTYSVAGRGS